MQQVLEQVIQPAARRFKTDLILVSAGERAWPTSLDSIRATILLHSAGFDLLLLLQESLSCSAQEGAAGTSVDPVD
jgi:hypothetical protein